MNSSVLSTTRCALALGFLAVSLVAVICVQPAKAHFQVNAYTHKGCPATAANRIDPINVVFYDWGTVDRAFSQTKSHTMPSYPFNWKSGQGGSSQKFQDHQGQTCVNQTYHLASNPFDISPRHHIRLHPIHQDANWGWTTVGDAHLEDWVQGNPYNRCSYFGNHAVKPNGFNDSRNSLWLDNYRYFPQGHYNAFYQYWGNDAVRPQCNGNRPASDGWVLWINLHQLNH